jgi:hypothetical protein
MPAPAWSLGTRPVATSHPLGQRHRNSRGRRKVLVHLLVVAARRRLVAVQHRVSGGLMHHTSTKRDFGLVGEVSVG